MERVRKPRLLARVAFRFMQHRAMYKHQIARFARLEYILRLVVRSGFLERRAHWDLGGRKWRDWIGDGLEARSAGGETHEAFGDGRGEMGAWEEGECSIGCCAFFEGDPETEGGGRGCVEES